MSCQCYTDGTVIRSLTARVIILVLLLCLSLIFSCSSSPEDVFDTLQSDDSAEQDISRREQLVLTFAGDIMAHTPNFKMRDYSRIYDDIRTYLKGDDFTFGNLEMPVADTLPMSTYPRFNVHSSYLQAAIDGGFDVFSLANNHSNDQYYAGIDGTLSAFSSRPLSHYSGLRRSENEELQPRLILHNGWRILFLSVTEILNSHDKTMDRVYYSSPGDKGRALLLSSLKQMTLDIPHDVFILSLHVNQPEYERTVRQSTRDWFAELADAGVDVVWAHHPHVMHEWEQTGLHFFMYSMGNFISGQRYTPNTNDPGADREYTGDAVLLRLSLSRYAGERGFDKIEHVPVLITNQTLNNGDVVVRRLTNEFIQSLPQTWKTYYAKRKELMESYLPALLADAQKAILEQ